MKKNQAGLSPKMYIKQRAKNLPIKECLIESDYKKLGMTNVVIVRQETGNKYTIGVFCVDIFCLGVKNAFCDCHLDEDAYTRICDSFSSIPLSVTPTFAHNLIYGAIDYAEELGFFPHKDFAFSENILDVNLIDEGINDIEFGFEGKPLFVEGPNDNAKLIINQLSKSLGRDNFNFTTLPDSFG